MAILTGDENANYITGTSGGDEIYGGAGNDTLVSMSAGWDYLYGEDGDDTLLLNGINGNASGGAGNDTLSGSAFSGTLYQSFSGGDGNDLITLNVGNASNGIADGGSGYDTLQSDCSTLSTYFSRAAATNIERYQASNATLGGTLTFYGTDNIVADLDLNKVGYVYGAAGNDLLTIVATNYGVALHGNDGHDTLVSGASSDFLFGEAGNDSLTGGDGDDSLTGGTGNDALDGGAGNDTLIGDSGYDTITGGEGDDLIRLTASSAGGLVDGAIGKDTVDGAYSDLSQWSFTDIEVFRVYGTNTLNATEAGKFARIELDSAYASGTVNFSGAGNAAGNLNLVGIEYINGGVGNDALSIDATDRAVTVHGNNGNDTLTSGTSSDILIGDAGNDSLVGGAGDDSITGGTGNDVIAGGAGNDTLIGDSGYDTISGGDNDDFIRLTASSTGGSVDGGTGNDTVEGAYSDLSQWTFTGNEVFRVYGTNTLNATEAGKFSTIELDSGYSTGTLNFSGTANATGSLNLAWIQYVNGGAGNDALSIASTNTAVTVHGNNGNDTLTSGTSSDILIGDAGNDSLVGGAGDDSITGGTGNDALIGGAGNDTLIGETGDDRYEVNISTDVIVETGDSLTGGVDTVTSYVSWTLGDSLENLTLTGTGAINGTGNSLANTLTGNSAANSLNGGAGNDTLSGGLGNDTYTVDSSGDVITESSDSISGGIDTVNASVTWTLGNYLEKLTLTGSAAINGTGNTLANTLTGNSVANSLNGGSGNDSLNGGTGNDTLIGGAGTDSLIGGVGNDTFDFNALSELGLGTTRDVISGWNAGDRIDLTTIDWNTSLAGDQAFSYIASSAFTTTAGQVRYDATTGVVQLNTDTDTAAEYEIVITGTPPASLVAASSLLL